MDPRWHPAPPLAFYRQLCAMPDMIVENIPHGTTVHHLRFALMRRGLTGFHMHAPTLSLQSNCWFTSIRFTTLATVFCALNLCAGMRVGGRLLSFRPGGRTVELQRIHMASTRAEKALRRAARKRLLVPPPAPPATPPAPAPPRQPFKMPVSFPPPATPPAPAPAPEEPAPQYTDEENAAWWHQRLHGTPVDCGYMTDDE